MLKEIKKEEIPQEVWNKLENSYSKDKFIKYYKASGMFGYKHTDYLMVLEEYEESDCIYCAGYVYNGAEPDFSEFGSFGLNKQRSERIW